MRYPASEKLEIIRLVERAHLPAKKTLDMLGIARPTFYRWYDLYQRFGGAALEDKRPGPQRAWNRVPETIQQQLVEMALEHSELSPRELAVRFTDEKRYFVSEATVYRLLKAHDLIGWLCWRARTEPHRWIAWSGGTILAVVALQSITDYPLRNLSMLAVAGFALCLLGRFGPDASSSRQQEILP